MSDPDRSTDLVAERAALIRSFFPHVPHNAALGMIVEELSSDRALMRLPYAPHLVGNPDDGFLHGGPVTALMDACCGLAVYMTLPQILPIATLDLRIDYLKPGLAHHDVLALAHCYKVTRHIAFVSCTAYHDLPAGQDQIASAAATFMLDTR